MDTLVAGMYMSHTWDTGGYLNFVLTGQAPHADIRTPDGFRDRILGNSLTLSSRVGHRYQLDDGWVLEPQAQLAVSAVSRGNKVDAAGKALVFDDDLIGTARAALRIEKRSDRDDGGVIRPWATLGVQRAVGGNESSVSVLPQGGSGAARVLPNHELGISARSADLDITVCKTKNPGHGRGFPCRDGTRGITRRGAGAPGIPSTARRVCRRACAAPR